LIVYIDSYVKLCFVYLFDTKGNLFKILRIKSNLLHMLIKL